MTDSVSRAEDAHSCLSDSSENSDILNMEDEEGWEDTVNDEEKISFKSLVDDQVFSDIYSMFDHCKHQSGLDFLDIRRKLALEFYDCIKLVNYIRTVTDDGKEIPSELSKSHFEDEKYLRPFLQDDAVLFSLDELPDISIDPDTSTPLSGSSNSDLVARINELENELRMTQAQFNNYRETVSKTLDDRWHDNSLAVDSHKDPGAKEATEVPGSNYYGLYDDNGIHETMLKDTVRTDAYRDFIYNNKNCFANKTVLDIGCGTGILSMFCVKAGAARVIAVDNSDIIDKARENIFLNGMDDKITCLRGEIEEVKLPVETVDIIVSEWMGYCLLYEAMLLSVIRARDLYLKPDGLMVPSHMKLWAAPVSSPEYFDNHYHFWKDVYGFDMKAMQAKFFDNVVLEDFGPEKLCGEPSPFKQMDLHTTTAQDLTFKSPWSSKLTTDIDSLDGFIIWFDTFFMPSRNDVLPDDAKAQDWVKAGNKGTSFTTGPFGKVTHWSKGFMMIDQVKERPIPRKSGDEITAWIQYSFSKTCWRWLTIKIEWKINEELSRTQSWKLE
ncbi:unnamed protein product [Blumeria hordei]|uniref:type I protein arginine methyltransferase n=1 Tax=Blumeria hordei TaxID=2867405 RepID=A0A383ULT6_BLUHO|nr:unnamed protein product [Blumeria hordei]